MPHTISYPSERGQHAADDQRSVASDDEPKRLPGAKSDLAHILTQIKERLDQHDLDGARQLLREKRDLAPNDEADIQNELGKTCSSLGEQEASESYFQDAVGAYDTALTLRGPGENPGTTAFRWRVTINKAVALWRWAEILEGSAAENLLIKAVALLEPITSVPLQNGNLIGGSEFIRAHEVLGNILVKLRHQDALHHLSVAEKAARTTPDKARILNNIGEYYLSINEFDRAFEFYSKAINILDKNSMPVEWSQTKRNIGLSLWYKSFSFQDNSENKKNISRSIDEFEEARSVCSFKLSPSLHILINESLIRAIGALSIIECDRNLFDKALRYHSEIFFESNEKQRRNLSEIIAKISKGFMDSCDNNLSSLNTDQRYEKIVSSMMAAADAYNVRPEEWPALSERLGHQFRIRSSQAENISPEPQEDIDDVSSDRPATQGAHTARVLAERGEAVDTPAAAYPKSWEEAKKRNPALLTWHDARDLAKEAGEPISIVDHLRNCETGLGQWTLSEPGLPRNVLRKIDSGAYAEIYQQGNQIPDDIHLPKGAAGRPKKGDTPSLEEWHEAVRIASLGYRRGVTRNQTK